MSDARDEAKELLTHYFAIAVPGGDLDEIASIVDRILEAAAEQTARAVAHHAAKVPHSSGYGVDE